MKTAIVVGHNSRSRGAVRVLDNVTEYDWNSGLAEMIMRGQDGVKVFHRTPGGGYQAEISRVYGEVDAWGAECSIELHFNSYHTSAPKGCLTLSSGTSGSMKLARIMQKNMQEVMREYDRGIRVIKREETSARGHASLWAGNAPAILIEPYFGSNPDSCMIADKRKSELAMMILEGARKFCKGL